jgi:hypothetical protein
MTEVFEGILMLSIQNPQRSRRGTPLEMFIDFRRTIPFGPRSNVSKGLFVREGESVSLKGVVVGKVPFLIRFRSLLTEQRSQDPIFHLSTRRDYIAHIYSYSLYQLFTARLVDHSILHIHTSHS